MPYLRPLLGNPTHRSCSHLLLIRTQICVGFFQHNKQWPFAPSFWEVPRPDKGVINYPKKRSDKFSLNRWRHTGDVKNADRLNVAEPCGKQCIQILLPVFPSTFGI